MPEGIVDRMTEALERLDDLVERVEGFITTGCDRDSLIKLHHDLIVLRKYF